MCISLQNMRRHNLNGGNVFVKQLMLTFGFLCDTISIKFQQQNSYKKVSINENSMYRLR